MTNVTTKPDSSQPQSETMIEDELGLGVVKFNHLYRNPVGSKNSTHFIWISKTSTYRLT
jgi:hypothetical protein